MLSIVVLTGALAAPAWFQAASSDPAPASSPTVADRVVLRDGRTVLGLITSTAAGPKVGFDMLVHRDWAEAHVPDLAAKWARNDGTRLKPRIAERLKRLRVWRETRAPHVPPGDPILAWIDAETERLNAPEPPDAPLLPVRIGRDGCRSAERNSDASRRLLALAWLCGVKTPEDRPPIDLEEAVEARGFLANGDDVPSLDRLMPMASEPDAKWLARQAATELAVDPGRRFLRFGDVLIPEPAEGALQAGAGVPLDPSLLLGKLGDLLNPDGARNADPLAPELARIAARGGTGAVVTRLNLADDLSRAGVDVALWVLGPRGWVEYGARESVVRPEDVQAGAGANLAQDPQVQAAFNAVDALGLGAVSPEMKERSLRIGAAVQAALGQAKGAFQQDLSGLAFPVLESAPMRNQGGPKREGTAPAATDPDPDAAKANGP